MHSSKSVKSSKTKINVVGQDSTDLTFKASFEDLRRPERKQSLRQHFTGAFPETRPSIESMKSSEMGFIDRLSRKASLLTVDKQEQASTETPQPPSVDIEEVKRLSTVRETTSAASNSVLDIEHAIQLLQELKKTASPSELVALHKALLPNRDSIISNATLATGPEDEEASPSGQNYTRRRSFVPPGFATRGGANGDPLKTKEEARSSKIWKKGRSSSRTASRDNLATPDIPEEPSYPAKDRPTTPPESDEPDMGAYRRGTLRITNGAASPDPSEMLRGQEQLMESQEKLVESEPQTTIDRKYSEDFDFRTAPATPVDRSSMQDGPSRDDIQLFKESRPGSESDQGLTHREAWELRSMEAAQARTPRKSRSREGSMSGIPVPTDKDPSSPRMHRPTRSREASRSRSRPREVSSTRAQSQTRLPLRVSKQSLTGASPSEPALPSTRTSRDIPPLDTKVSELSMRDISRSSLEQLNGAADDGRVSPITEEMLPRFAQRWSHRLSHLPPESGESGEDDQLPANPTRNSAALDNLAKRLSTVYSETGTAVVETPQVALSKLEAGTSAIVVERMIETQFAAGNDEPLLSPTVYNRWERPSPSKIDSGYGSDASYRNAIKSQLASVNEPASARNLRSSSSNAPEPINTTVANTFITRTIIDEDDGASLYSFKAILKSPQLLEGLSMPSPSPSPAPTSEGKKHSSLLNLARGRRISLGPLSPRPNDSSLTLTSVTESSPAETRSSKQQNKLQKPMPASLRKDLQKKKRQSVDISLPEVQADHSAIELSANASTTILATTTIDKTITQRMELSGDPPAAELEAATPRRSLSRQASRRGRERSSTTVQPSEKQEPKMQRAFSLNRMRSKSKRSEPPVTKTSNKKSWRNSTGGPAPKEGVNEDLLTAMEISTAARAIGSSPYDASTPSLNRTIAAPGNAVVQLPPTSPGFSRSKNGGLRGMDSGMASELARMKSRDVAIQNNEPIYERPRVAKPKSRRGDRERSQTAPSSPAASQHEFPQPERNMSSTTLPPEGRELSARRNSAYAESIVESIPPMPELPAYVEVKMSRVNDLVSKTIRTSDTAVAKMTVPKPQEPVRESAPPAILTPGRKSQERPGDSTQTIADAIKKAMEISPSEDGKVAERSTSLKKSKSKRKKKTASAQTATTTSTTSTTSTVTTTTRHVVSGGSEVSIIIGVDADLSPQIQHPSGDSTSWSQSAQIWRAIRDSSRESLGETLKQDVYSPNENITPSSEYTSSPAIVVSQHNEPYNDRNSLPSQQRRTSAPDRAIEYQEVIGEDKENYLTDEGYFDQSPASSVSASAQSSSEKFLARESKAGFDSTYYAKPYQNGTPTERAKSPGGRVRTPSGKFHPYTPADAERAQRSRAESLAKLTGGGSGASDAGGKQVVEKAVSVTKKATSKPNPDTSFREKNERTVEKTAVIAKAGKATVVDRSTKATSTMVDRATSPNVFKFPGRPGNSGHQQSDTLDSLIDRYTAGSKLQQAAGYEKGVYSTGIGAAAGTGLQQQVKENESVGTSKTPTKLKKAHGRRASKGLSQQLGLDLSDVPVSSA